MSFRGFKYKTVILGGVVGLFAGIVISLFRLFLSFFENVMSKFIAYAKIAKINPIAIFAFILVILVFAFITTALLKWEPLISGSGIPQVEGEIKGFFDPKWWRVLLAKFAGGIMTIGCGLSLGREGPSIQLGAMVGKGVSRIYKKISQKINIDEYIDEKTMLICGASAGLSAAFNAPVAAILFPIEEVQKGFSAETLLSSMASACVAAFVSANIFGLKPVLSFMIDPMSPAQIPLSSILFIVLFSILIGAFGVFYNACVKNTQWLFDKIKQPYVKVLIPFVLAILFSFCMPQVLGGGSDLIKSVSIGIPLATIIAIFIVKYCFSVVSFSSGVPGGIFLPLLVIGSMCGAIFCGAFDLMGISLNLNALMLIGMVACLSATVRAPITSILLVTEMSGDLSNIFYFAVAGVISYAVADLLKGKPIYDQLLERMLKNKNAKKSSV